MTPTQQTHVDKKKTPGKNNHLYRHALSLTFFYLWATDQVLGLLRFAQFVCLELFECETTTMVGRNTTKGKLSNAVNTISTFVVSTFIFPWKCHDNWVHSHCVDCALFERKVARFCACSSAVVVRRSHYWLFTSLTFIYFFNDVLKNQNFIYFKYESVWILLKFIYRKGSNISALWAIWNKFLRKNCSINISSVVNRMNVTHVQHHMWNINLVKQNVENNSYCHVDSESVFRSRYDRIFWSRTLACIISKIQSTRSH